MAATPPADLHQKFIGLSLDAQPAISYTGISASHEARQHNGNVYNSTETLGIRELVRPLAYHSQMAPTTTLYGNGGLTIRLLNKEETTSSCRQPLKGRCRV